MTIKERIASLMNVKSIITIILTGVFGYLSCMALITPEQFLTVFTMVISFYFGIQSERKRSDNTTVADEVETDPIESDELVFDSMDEEDK